MDIIPKDRDFFISYAARDRLWAEWIAWQLANAGYATIADWEFLPGTNRVLQAQTAIARAKRTIAVLSNAYVTSQNSRDEWTTVTKLDPTGHDRRLIPVVVESVQTTGFLATVVCIELVDLDEIKARERLLSALRAEKAKPASAPIFPRVIPAVSAPFPPLEHFLNIVVVDADDEPVPETTVKVFKGDILIAESVTNGNPLKIVVSERPQDLRVEAVSGAHKVEMPIRTTDSQCKIRFSNLRRKRVPVQPVSEEQPVPLIIACPIIAEYEIMSRSLTKHQQVGADGPLIATIGQLGRHRVVCVQTGKGETETAAALQWALGKWKSRWVLLVGIAGGFPEQKVRRGDVVVATFVYNFDFGKIEDKRFIRRPELDFQSDRKLLAYANLVAVRRAVTWTDTIRETRPDKEPNTASKLSFGYIGSSNKVIDDPSYESFREVRTIIPELHAVEMEGSGAGSVIRLEQSTRPVGFIMIRGISDEPGTATGPSEGAEQRSQWKNYAAAAAAAFTEALLNELPAETDLPSTDVLAQQNRGGYVDAMTAGSTGRAGSEAATGEVLNSQEGPLGLRSKPVHKRLVMSLHGIRTRGAWQKDIAQALEEGNFQYQPLDYGFFSLIKFVMPWSRKNEVQWFLNEYTRAAEIDPTPSIIAHSFGTYIVAYALVKFAEIKLDTLIFCGSIVPVHFPWTAIATNRQIRRVLNDYGKLDIWTRAVEWVVKDAGSSGSKGFEDTAAGLVIQRFRPRFRHSDYFYMLNYRQTWVPFLQGKPINASGGTDAGTFNWKFAVVRWLILFLLLTGASYFGFAAWSKMRTPTQSGSAPHVVNTLRPSKVNTNAVENNTWYSLTSSDTVFIFVHGIFSNAKDCWTAESGTFWPEILKEDKRFGNPGIFLGGYYTDYSSGNYRINNAADELLSYLHVSDAAGNPAPLSKPNIVFVSHSTGGLVVRYVLERYKDLFTMKTVGLVLLASPSRGSAWANRVKWLRELFKNRMLSQLEKDNDAMYDLDSRFADLVHDRKIPRLVGIDAFENKFIIPGLIFNTTHVVSDNESASYFGGSKIIPKTDHFSIAKPTSPSDPSHQFLFEFYEKRFKPVATLNEGEKRLGRQQNIQPRRLEILESTSRHFEAYIANWGKLRHIAVLESLRPLTAEEKKRKERYVTDRDKAKTDLSAALDVAKFHFSINLTTLINQYRAWDTAHSTKRLHELPPLSDWEEWKSKISEAMTKEIDGKNVSLK